MEGIIAMMLKAKSYEITKRSVERGGKKGCRVARVSMWSRGERARQTEKEQ